MTESEYREGLKEIITHYGIGGQRIKLVEECAELIHATIKGDIKGMISEIADVEILIEQMKMHYGFADNVDVEKSYKVTRQLTRIADENKAKGGVKK